MKLTSFALLLWLCCSAAMPLFCQNPFGLSDRELESFDNGLCWPLQKGHAQDVIELGRFTQKGGNPRGHYFAVVTGPRVDVSAVSIQRFVLPPDNTADEFSRSQMPADMHSVLVGKVAAGAWVPLKYALPYLSEAQKAEYEPGDKWMLIPNYIVADDQHPKNMAYRMILDAAPEDEIVRRAGGVYNVQAFVQNKKEIERIKVLEGNVPVTRLANYDPIDPSGALLAGGKPRQEYETRMSTESHHVQEIKSNYGSVPGGVLYHSDAEIHGGDIRQIAYDATQNRFLLNSGAFSFSPNLSRQEVAELARLAASPDPRLGALRQNEFVGGSEKSPVIQAIAEADILLGKFAYGFDMKGAFFKGKGLLAEYENPERERLSNLRWWWWGHGDAVEQQTRIVCESIEPRLFLEFGKTQFTLDAATRTLKPVNSKIDISLTAFTYDWAGNEQFLEDPVAQFPEISAAIEHLKDNFPMYAQEFLAFKKAQDINLTFAFLRNLVLQKVPCAGWDDLVSISALEVPFVYENYNDFSAQSDCAQAAAAALSSLEYKWEWLMGGAEKFNYNRLLLNLACMAHDLPKIARYQQRVLALLGQIDPDQRNHRLRMEADGFSANGMAAKIAFADRYANASPDLALRYYKQAQAYYQQMRHLQPDSPWPVLQLAYIAASMKIDNKSLYKQAIPLLEAATAKGDPNAAIRLGRAWENGFAGQNDVATALYYYQQAADWGYPLAWRYLGEHYYFDQNKKSKAIKCFEQGALLQEAYCEAAYGGFLMTGIGGAIKNEAVGRQYMEAAAAHGEPGGHFWLGQMYKNGIYGLPCDLRLARHHFAIAASLGAEGAAAALASLTR